MNVDYQVLIESLKNTAVPKPLSGTLSGHAVGEPFDKHVYSEIKKHLVNIVYQVFLLYIRTLE